MSTYSTDLPEPDIFEVSLFGPGKGESVVVHLGAHRWLVVDSCRDQRTREVAALKYLGGMGVDLDNDVRAIVATHAHDDHFDGIADIFEACGKAVVVTSQAIVNRDFLALVVAENDISGVSKTASYREYRKIFDLADKRKDRATGFRPLRRAEENKNILALPAVGVAPEVKVTALSPSEHAVTRALEALAKDQLYAMGERSRRSTFDPNEASIALWVTAGPINVLLGADLLSGPVGCGWGAVLNTFTPDNCATLYKAAHHGSSTSHHEGLWGNLLAENPVVFLTPFRSGSVSVPKDSDIEYYHSRTDKVWTTAVGKPTPGAAFRRQASKLGTLAQNPHDPYGMVGQLRARAPFSGGAWKIDSFAPAGRVLRN